MFTGLYTALITPFKDNAIDVQGFQSLIEQQIEQGVSGLLVCGTTAETPTMNSDEYTKAIDVCIKTVNSRVPVIVGTGANDTNATILKTQQAEKMGANAVLIVTPYYNKPTQEGLYQHYKAIHDATNIPIILYNVPTRTSVNLEVETISRLALLPRIVGIKDATNDIMRPLKIRQATNDDFSILSGEDASIVAFLAHGGNGCISVTSNIAPKLCSDLIKAWFDKDLEKAFEIRDILLPLHESMFVETNPAPVKYAAFLQGFGNGSVRLPLVEISDKSKTIVENAMKNAGVLK